ncbi:protein of unknown function DUF52 [Methanothermus fervidus DSM 2088]|uniref:MEMO1 family protein Mfer_0894 n=1 Tax=Methanothermus fervidus (strain ATCC 43054 / DSM 2088 / JCM 10308 / V24 S) TaxID=523846 RepID=E3GZG0_METFV|nr:MEMO1 family protein [Methanothermus fervidus]ADP77692.1 protein of unknown function DUF52 [Methanothermus fervidus DSM 2088]
MKRKPAVAGTFYESDPKALKNRIEWCFKHELGPGDFPKVGGDRNIVGVIAPHAGYIYSGPIAAHAYYRIVEDGFPETFIILCPNHTGMGSSVSLMAEGEWETPLGSVKIDEEFSSELFKKSEIIDIDDTAHSQEHSCEVHIPFLQYFKKDFKIVPICMWLQDLETTKEVAQAIVDTIKSLNKDIVLIASTDFTHYEPQEIAESTDKKIIDAILKLDEKVMYKRINDLNATMCGYGPVSVVLISSKKLGANKARLLKYGTSGDVTGDRSSVVGYASITIEK